VRANDHASAEAGQDQTIASRIAAAAIAAFVAWIAGPAAGESASGPYSADWLQVRGIETADVHTRPSGAAVARVPEGAVLRNMGCAGSGSRRWCRVAMPNGGSGGWIYARFLRARDWH
jgi:hypothetical protein